MSRDRKADFGGIDMAAIFEKENEDNLPPDLAARFAGQKKSGTFNAADAGQFKTFKAISNGALKGATLPARLKVFGWGDNESTDGVFRAGSKTAAQLGSNQRNAGFERVAIDFNHCTVPGTDTYNDLIRAGQPPLIFGYGRVNPLPGDGIYLEEIQWTPLGIQHARNFEDISPALRDDNREVTMIHSVALTPNGKVTGLQFFSAGAPQSKFRDASGRVDMAALLDAENADNAARASHVANARPRTFAAQNSPATTVAQCIATLSARSQVARKADGSVYTLNELKQLDLSTLQLLCANVPNFRNEDGTVDLAAIFRHETALAR
jgi:hypothetical protein